MTFHRTTIALIAAAATFASGSGAALACGGPDMSPGGFVHAAKTHTSSHAKHHTHIKRLATQK